MASAELIAARILMRPPHRGHFKTSISKTTLQTCLEQTPNKPRTKAAKCDPVPGFMRLKLGSVPSFLGTEIPFQHVRIVPGRGTVPALRNAPLYEPSQAAYLSFLMWTERSTKSPAGIRVPGIKQEPLLHDHWFTFGQTLSDVDSTTTS